MYLRPVEGIILLAVIELFLDSLADFHAVLRCDSEVTTVKQRVHILPEQDSVCRLMGATLRIGFDVSGVQHMEDVRTGQSTLSVVIVGNDDAECTLSQPGQNCGRVAEARLHEWWLRRLDTTGVKYLLNPVPQLRPIWLVSAVTFAPDDVLCPRRRWYPVRPVEEERLLQEDASDQIILTPHCRHSTVLLNSHSQLLLVCRAVLFLERAPCKGCRQNGEMAEKTASHNEIIGAV